MQMRSAINVPAAATTSAAGVDVWAWPRDGGYSGRRRRFLAKSNLNVRTEQNSILYSGAWNWKRESMREWQWGRRSSS